MDAGDWIEAQRRMRVALRDRCAGESSAETRDEDGRARGMAGAGGVAPRVSAIVVCFEAVETLPRCLEQLLAQDYPDYEVIVVDDGSNDGTLAVARSCLERGGREHRIVRSGRNRGCPHARNLGLARASGEIVAFVDADGYAAPDWLSEIARAFAADERIGAVASTVFYDADPLVLNGAGGTVNRQGWAADLSMNEPYERAQIAAEALYPMGCGMALRRAAIAAVGPFDDRMRNYYDDVDYGVRVWRAGYRVAVAANAWIDHAGGLSATEAAGSLAHTAMLCERHRMRVVIKHAALSSLSSWSAHEARALRAASPAVRARKLCAIGWNLVRLPSALAGRARLRDRPRRPPDRLIDPGWGDAFPVGVTEVRLPRPQQASGRIDMTERGSAGQLPYGWFPVEHVDGRSHRWAGVQAAAIVRLAAPARRLRLDYTHVPVDVGGVDVSIRRLGADDPLATVWSTRLLWQYLARSVENHPIDLPAGDYEVVFGVREGWLEPPLNARTISMALASMSFEDSFQLPSGGLDMGSPAVEQQLVRGWFEAEESEGRAYRWASGCAQAVVRLAQRASGARLGYRFPPVPVGGLWLTLSALDAPQPLWSARVPWTDADWHEQELTLDLPTGDYLASFSTDMQATWSNRDGADTSLWPENRSLGFAVSALSFAEQS